MIEKKECLTLNELACRWNKHGVGQTDILHYMETGKLSAWLRVQKTNKLEQLHFDENWNVINRTPCLENGIGSDLFEIVFFNKIVWKNIEGWRCANFYELGILLTGKFGKAYRFRSSFVVSQDNDLLVMMKDIVKFEQVEPAEEKALLPLQDCTSLLEEVEQGEAVLIVTPAPAAEETEVEEQKKSAAEVLVPFVHSGLKVPDTEKVKKYYSQEAERLMNLGYTEQEIAKVLHGCEYVTPPMIGEILCPGGDNPDGYTFASRANRLINTGNVYGKRKKKKTC